MNTNGRAPRNGSRLPPELRGGLPFLGHAWEFHKNPVGLLQRGRDRFGEIFSFLLAGTNVAVLTGPRANEAFFRAGDDVASARAAYRFTVPIFGEGVAYGTTPERMAEQMALVTPALTERRLRTYASFIQNEVETYLASWPNTGEIDLLKVTNELTTFIATRCLIGREFRKDLSSEFAALYHDLEGGINLLAFFWPHLPLPSFRRRDRARQRMVELITRIINGRRSRGTDEEDFLQTLMTARYGDGTALSEDVITGFLLTLIFAGQHTSSVLAAWTGVELLVHPQTLEAVRTEQRDVLGDAAEVTFDDLGRMTVLQRVVQESERLHPPIVMLMRKLEREFTYQDYCLPAGWLIMASPAVSHRIADVFPQPERFDPERFAPGREEHRKAKFSIITFGGGKHGCIGGTFAYLQIKAIWSTLVRRFDLELIDRHPEPDYTTFVIGPKRPCRIRFQRRPAATTTLTERATPAAAARS